MFIQFTRAAIAGAFLLAVILALAMPFSEWGRLSFSEALIAFTAVAIGAFLIGGVAVLVSLALRHDREGPLGEYNPKNLLPFI